MNNEIKYVSPFKKFCITVGNLPTAYLESMSYYEGLTYLVNYLSNNVIPALNNNGEVVEELQEQFTILKNYVDNYFENLDVQEEVNNKLDEMAESGELTDIIAQYLGLAGMLVYNTVADLKAAQNIVNGSSCQTLGYYVVNDGGKAKYKVRPITNEDVVDDSIILSLANPNLIAELLVDETVTPEQVGCYGDGTNDDTTKFQILLNLQKNIELKDNATYLLTGNVDLPLYTHIEGNKATIKYEYNGTREHQIRNANWLNNNNELNTLYLNNTNFYVNSTNRQIKLIGLSDYNNIVISNCNYSNNLGLSYGSWFFDLYSNCSNVLIDNINVETLTTNENLMNTCIGVREYRSAKTSDNIKIVNSKFIHNAKDETVWIDSWFGTLSNLIINNCLIHDKSTTDTTMSWVGSANDNAGTTFKNCLLNNCILIKDEIDAAGFKFGYQGNSDNNNCENFKLQNSIIIGKTGSGSLLVTSRYAKDVYIENCKIKLESISSYSYGYVSTGNFKMKNCNIEASAAVNSSSTAFWNMIDGIENCTIKLNGGRGFNQWITKIKNSTITGLNILFNAQNITNDIDLEIINCNIEVADKFISRIDITTASKILIKDCNIKQSSESVIYDYAVSGTKDTRIINTNFEGDTLNLTDITTEKITINNCTKKGFPLTGIPATQQDRGSCVVGTVFNAGAGHTIVRKISEGNDLSNWETL